MVQAAESRVRNNPTLRCRRNSAVRRFLVQSEVSAVIVIIAEVLGEKPLQVALIQCDDMVE